SLQRKINGGATVNSNKVVLSNVAILGVGTPIIIGQKIVNVNKPISVKIIGSFNKKVTVTKVSL
ncbi:MAG: hypothetical protein ABRQ27_12795, partial [Clostridiaceae bacterium]